MIHSKYVDEETSDYLTYTHLMQEYHLSPKQIDDLPIDLLNFIMIKDKELNKVQKKKLEEQERRMKKITSRQRIY